MNTARTGTKRTRIFDLGALILAGAAVAGLCWWRSGSAEIVPYRFPLRDSRSPEKEIRFLEERVRLNPEGLDLAALAGAYGGMARRTGHAAWYAKAEQAARRSLETLPRFNDGAKMALAQVAEARHEFSRALALAGEVLKARPGHADALALRVTSNLALGRPDEAGRAAEELVDRRPTLNAFALRALVFEASGRDREALLDFETAISVEDVGESGGSAWVRMLLARFHFRRGRPGIAGHLLRQALRIVPGHAPAEGLLGEIAAEEGDLEKGEHHLILASINAHDPAPVVSLARLKARRGESVEAERLYAEAEDSMRREIRDGRFGHRGTLARLLLHRSRPEDRAEALALAQTESEARRNPETLDTLAWALLASGRPREAQHFLREALRTGIRDAEIYTRACSVEAALGNASRAALYSRLAVETNPSFNVDKGATRAVPGSGRCASASRGRPVGDPR